MSKPQVKNGDIVFVAHPNCRNNGMVICPAIVMQQFNEDSPHLDTLCNLYVFVPFMTPQQVGSVTLLAHSRTHEEVEADPLFVGCWSRDSVAAGAMGASLNAAA